MEALTVVATVASIAQLAHLAFNLSTTIHTFASTISSAPEELTVLADDLHTFSQSLTILSRLLEDSKQHYSDDVYLLTAKIIKDCADLYKRIDKFVLKLASGKSWWKRAKWAFEEGNIKKLLERLRDLKGTLATVLMSLQIDLQLSLLDIYCASKIRRYPENEPQGNTLHSLGTVHTYSTSTLPPYNDMQVADQRQYYDSRTSMFSTSRALSGDQIHNTWDIAHHNFVEPGTDFSHIGQSSTSTTPGDNTALPSIHSPSNTSTRRTSELTNSFTQSVSYSMPEPGTEDHSFETFVERFLKRSRSSESLRSFLSMQSESDIIATSTQYIKGIIQIFDDALDILDSSIERIGSASNCITEVVGNLRNSIVKARKEINERHGAYLSQYGYDYIETIFTEASTELQELNTAIESTIIAPLHEIISINYTKIDTSSLEELILTLEDYSTQVLTLLAAVAESITLDPCNPDYYFWAPERDWQGVNHKTVSKAGEDHSIYQPGEHPGYLFDCFGGKRHCHHPVPDPFPILELKAEELTENKLKAKKMRTMLHEREKQRRHRAFENSTLEPAYQHEDREAAGEIVDISLPFISFRGPYLYNSFFVHHDISEPIASPERIKRESPDQNQRWHNFLDQQELRMKAVFQPPIHKNPDGINWAKWSKPNEWKEASSTNLPFMGYTFKRFEQFNHPDRPYVIGKTPPVKPFLSHTLVNIRPISPSPKEIQCQELTAKLKNRVVYPFEPRTLWQSALLELQEAKPVVHTSLVKMLNKVFGFNVAIATYESNEIFCASIAALVGSFKTVHRHPPGKMTDAGEKASLRAADDEQQLEKVIAIVETINEMLGLKAGGVAWACVYSMICLLHKSQTPTKSQTNTQTTLPTHTHIPNTLLAQLITITSILARYTVLETLYSAFSPALLLRSSYKAQLTNLCTTILEWFESGLGVLMRLSEGKQLDTKEEESDDDGKANNSPSSGIHEEAKKVGKGVDDDILEVKGIGNGKFGEVKERMKRCEEIYARVLEKEGDARGFRILVDKVDFLDFKGDGDLDVDLEFEEEEEREEEEGKREEVA